MVRLVRVVRVRVWVIRVDKVDKKYRVRMVKGVIVKVRSSEIQKGQSAAAPDGYP